AATAILRWDANAEKAERRHLAMKFARNLARFLPSGAVRHDLGFDEPAHLLAEHPMLLTDMNGVHGKPYDDLFRVQASSYAAILAMPLAPPAIPVRTWRRTCGLC